LSILREKIGGFFRPKPRTPGGATICAYEDAALLLRFPRQQLGDIGVS
jgi:hypothetical protein